MPRTLYLVAYDVCGDARRLARVGRYLRSYRVAGQKSVPEIWVTPAELRTISAAMAHSVQALRQQVGPHDDAPGQQPAHAEADHADDDDAESYNDA